MHLWRECHESNSGCRWIRMVVSFPLLVLGSSQDTPRAIRHNHTCSTKKDRIKKEKEKKHTHTGQKKKGLQNEFVQVMHHLRKHSDPPESLQDMSKTVLEWTSQRPDLNLTEHLRRWRRQSRDAFPSSLEKFKRICWKENCPNPGVQILQTLSQKDLKLQLLLQSPG